MSAVDQLDQLTEALERATAGAIAPLLETRAGLIAEIVASRAAGVPDERTVAVLRRASEAGVRLRQRLMVERATRRDELGRLYHAGCLMRALAADRGAPSRIDCQG